ncbi:hypothetical protein [Geobacter benzoatilyticus]|uniref:Uncharacterized protein n=1 Tax=Geobacter benzoatilyticus TaxID=2815309 RepID=A0ABX7Q0S5_9BACT|nr:hypothetical protein [Geobacter benzoatilyticus]QSV44693.1 hypothetical protein JZM60_10985 [Geobacter benzoatilyticus]
MQAKNQRLLPSWPAGKCRLHAEGGISEGTVSGGGADGFDREKEMEGMIGNSCILAPLHGFFLDMSFIVMGVLLDSGRSWGYEF